MWTFQESWLARDDPIVICGSNQCSTGVLVEALQSLHETIEAYHSRKYYFLDIKSRQRNHSFVARSLSTHLTTSMFTASQFRSQHRARMGGHGVGNLLPAGITLHLVGGRACTLDHGRVYTLFGCVAGLADACPVDYNRPIEQVMHEFANFLSIAVNYLGRFIFSTCSKIGLGSTPPGFLILGTQTSLLGPSRHISTLLCASYRLA